MEIDKTEIELEDLIEYYDAERVESIELRMASRRCLAMSSRTLDVPLHEGCS